MYIAEISPAKWRGRLVGFFQFNVVLGILLAISPTTLSGRFSLAPSMALEARHLGFAGRFFLAMLFGFPAARAGSPKKAH